MSARRLPPGFSWQPLSPNWHHRNTLVLDFIHVASISERVDGAGWAVSVNKQRDDHRERGFAIASDEAQAKDWATRWVLRDEALIRKEVAAYRVRLSR